MKYYGIVDSFKKEHKAGIYGRVPSYEEKIKNIFLPKVASGAKFYIRTMTTPLIWNSGDQLINKYFYKQIQWQSSSKEIECNAIVIKNSLMENHYEIDKELMYGLFNKVIRKQKAFKEIMTSKGGSDLYIYEKNNLPPQIKHIGGEKGIFSEGLYAPHPKDQNILIPLDNYDKLIQTLILEETIRAYEALGAKEILIEDVTEIENNSNIKRKNIKIDTDGKRKKEQLRIKQYGKGTFDKERAIKDKMFIYDMPAVMSTIEARIEGNQTSDDFVETVDLNIGIDVDVLELFKGKDRFSYKRKWRFKVEFYDKNELNS